MKKDSTSIWYIIISHRTLAQEENYKMHHVLVCVCVRALVCHAHFSKTTATDFFVN